MAKALQLIFSNALGQEKRKGPYRLVRFEGETMRAEPGEPVVARHVKHEWLVDGEEFARLECDCSAQLHFERVNGERSTTYGPFESVSFIDGVAYANREIFAFADRSSVDWYCHEDDQHWPLMVLTPVG
jgi:hypothetical protein